MTVVVGFSPQPDGRAALDAAVEHASRLGERIVLVNATRGDAPADPRYASEADLATLAADLDARGIDHEIRHCIAPDVARAVLEAAEEVRASLVVVGVRRRTPVGKLILGSVAQTVILQAEAPVLCVKPTPH